MSEKTTPLTQKAASMWTCPHGGEHTRQIATTWCGCHRPDEDQVVAIIKALDADKAKSIEEMPDIDAALRVFARAYYRLKELGFRDIIYAPKDDTTFEVVEAGSTGIFKCNYWEQPTRGSFWIQEDGGTPSHPVLWRPCRKVEV